MAKNKVANHSAAHLNWINLHPMVQLVGFTSVIWRFFFDLSDLTIFFRHQRLNEFFPLQVCGVLWRRGRQLWNWEKHLLITCNTYLMRRLWSFTARVIFYFFNLSQNWSYYSSFLANICYWFSEIFVVHTTHHLNFGGVFLRHWVCQNVQGISLYSFSLFH